MSVYFVAGGSYQDLNGNECFALACPRPNEPLYVMVDEITRYFLIWQNAHLYQVEEDYTLALFAPSPEALKCGIKAPERVTPDEDLLEKLQAVIKLS